MTPVPLVAHRREEVAEEAGAWLASPALRRLVTRLGGPSGAEPDALARWSAVALETRHGVERRDAPRVAWEPARIDAVLEAAGPLGLVSTERPQLTGYDTTVLLGGATTGNRLRTELAARLARSGVDIGLLALVTAARPIGAREHETDPDSRGDAWESENLLRRVDDAFGPLSLLHHDRGTAWEDRRLSSRDGRVVRLLVAPPANGRARASTADGIRFLLRRVEGGGGRRLLLVTSAIYAPYQFFAVVPLLLEGRRRHVELVGTRTATEDVDRALLAQRVAQEIHAAVTAAAAVIAGRGTGSR